MVGAHFYDIPGSGRTFTTYPGRDALLRHTRVRTHFYDIPGSDLRKGDLFVLSWARVRRVRRGSISSELLGCGGGVRSILLLPLVARCLETIDVCIWRMFVCLL